MTPLPLALVHDLPIELTHFRVPLLLTGGFPVGLVGKAVCGIFRAGGGPQIRCAIAIASCSIGADG